MRTVSNHKQLLIDNAGTYPADGTVFTDAQAAGVVAVVDAANKVQSAAVTGDYFWVVQSQGPGLPLIKSNAIPVGKAKITNKATAAAVAQLTYIGYNGVSGAIDFTADTPIIYRGSLKTNFYQFQDKEVHVLADALPTLADTEETVTLKLAKSLINNSEKYVNVPFTVSRVSSAAGVVTTEAITFTKGSKLAVTATGVDFVVGSYVRAGLLATDAVYKVVAINGGDLTLDVAYQGANEVIAIAAAQFITEANAQAGTFGIKLEGKARRFQEGVFRYETNKWVSTVQGVGAATSITETAAKEGSGTYAQVAEDEWFFQLQEGMHQSNLIQVPPVAMRKNVEFGATYDLVELEWSDIAGGTDILHNPVNFKGLRIAYKAANTYDPSTLKTILDILTV